MAVNGQFNINFICHKDKRSTPGFYWDNANDAALIALANALDGISLATVGKQFVTESRQVAPGSAVAPPGTASRGKKFVLKYRDNVTLSTHQIEVPGADDGLLTAGSDDISLTAGPGLTVKTTMEAAAVSPDGNPVTLYQITFDTRNIE